MIFSYCITKMMFLSFCNECSSLCLYNIPSTYIVVYNISFLTSTPTTYFYIDMCVVVCTHLVISNTIPLLLLEWFFCSDEIFKMFVYFIKLHYVTK